MEKDIANENRRVFSDNLKKYMALNGKTRKDISLALDVSYYTVSDWVNGKKQARMDKVEMLANYFGVKKSDLIEEQMEKPTAGNDGLSKGKLELIEQIKKLPEDKVLMLLQVAKSIR